ncbi:uncharacterized protein LOC110442719 [Mizuhopecten yessoensis]|uniref:Uncharacterized protein n=1 Tax=Mizuhopecten yessoensis TaxID=6573 RepID=A0A210PGL1_MIZYE|nr:uncharacterized protein LOC110442719 [Mizuhopecten yessoensis]OWF35633.1 hypothetical protein KP79_PYT13863 [Mizuhopecten yessoensis]
MMERQFQSPRLFEGLELRGRNSLSPYPMPSLTKSQSSLLMDHGNTDIYSTRSQNNECRLERDFGEEKIFEETKCRNSPQVVPFRNDDFCCNEKDLYVVFKVEGLPSRHENRTQSRGRTTPYLQQQPSQENGKRKTKTAFIKRKLNQNDMMVSGTRFSVSKLGTNRSTSFKENRKISLAKNHNEKALGHSRQRSVREREGLPCDQLEMPIKTSCDELYGNSTREPLQDIQNVWDTKLDKRLVTEVSRHTSDHDREIEKLTRELREANNILNDIETNIYALKDEKDVSHQGLLAIKENYRNLLEEKNTCQKQISFIKKDLNNYRIKDRRQVREFDQLNLCYGKLDQRERLMRRQISLMEAELSLVVSKLETPKQSNGKPIVPRLDLSKLQQPKKLPPVKTPHGSLRKMKELQQTYPVVPNAPRKLCEIIQVYDSKESPRKMKRSMWPQRSTSSPLLGNAGAKTIPSGRDTGGDSFVPLVGSHCPLSSRSDKEDRLDFTIMSTINGTSIPKEYKVLKLPSINEDYYENKQKASKEFVAGQAPFFSKPNGNQTESSAAFVPD